MRSQKKEGERFQDIRVIIAANLRHAQIASSLRHHTRIRENFILCGMIEQEYVPGYSSRGCDQILDAFPGGLYSTVRSAGVED